MKTYTPLFLFIILSITISQLSCADRYKRPMHINKVKELGLEIWTEYEPEWSKEVVYQGGKPLFITQSPLHVSPPAAMSYISFPGIVVTADELKQVATSAIKEAAKNYQVSPSFRNAIQPKSAKYNHLNGYEAGFSGIAQGEAVARAIALK